MRLLVLIVAVLASAACSGATETAAAPAPLCRVTVAATAERQAVATVRPLARRLWKALRAPGMSLAVAVDGRIVFSTACGWADRERRLPARATTRFRIGSVSKPITAAALATLVEAGRIDLAAPIQRYVPEFPEKASPMTVSQVAAHLAGLRANDDNEIVSRRHFDTVAEEVAVFAGDPLLFAPGTRYSYSNWGYVLLGRAIETASGEPFEVYVRSAVLAPLGMSHTQLDDAGAPVAQRAGLYEVTSDGRAVAAPRHDVSLRWPSGGFVSTAEDLVRLGLGFTARDLVAPETRAQFLAEQRTIGGQPTGYALGWEVHDTPYGKGYGHTGNAVGGTALLLSIPARGAVLALATNIGYVTASAPPAIRGPDPHELLVP